MAISQLVLEQRRHFRMSFGLMAGCLAGGVAVSNERGVFVPPHSVREAFEATARAFAAIAAPPGQIGLQPYNLLFNPPSFDANRLPDQIARRIFNPAPPANNPFPGVFPSGASNAPATNTGNGETATNTDTPSTDGTTGDTTGGGVAPPALPGTGGGGGFTGTPTPVTNLGTTPPVTTPGDTGTTPGTGTTPPGDGGTTPGGGTTTPGGGTTTPGGGTTTPGDGGTTTPGGGTTTPGGGTTTPGGGTTTPGGGTTTPPGGTTDPTQPCIGATCQPIVPPCIGVACPPVNPPDEHPPTSAVPEPSNWAMLILGFGIIGGLQRWVSRKNRLQTA